MCTHKEHMCDSIGSAVFYGPVHITVEKMTCEAMTREPCTELMDQRPFSLNCRDTWHHITWAMIIGASVIAGSVFFAFRIGEKLITPKKQNSIHMIFTSLHTHWTHTQMQQAQKKLCAHEDHWRVQHWISDNCHNWENVRV